MFREGETIIVTGAAGAMGAGVMHLWAYKYPKVRFVVLDKLTYAGRQENLPKASNIAFVQGDVCNTELVSYLFDKEKPTVLVHLAAMTHVDQSFGNSFEFTQSNTMGTHNLLECAKRYGKLRLFIHMSTDEVYGEVADDTTMCDETSILEPTNPYASSKAAAEMLCRAYIKSFRLPVIIVRCNNIISPFQHTEKLVPCCVDKIMKGQKVPIQGTGLSKRTFIHVNDVASALETVIARGKTGAIYNIGTPSETHEFTVLEIVQKVLDLILPGEDYENWVEFVPDRAFQDRRYGIDSSALRALGWYEKYTVEDGIIDVFRKMCAI